jgi:Putative adhesin
MNYFLTITFTLLSFLSTVFAEEIDPNASSIESKSRNRKEYNLVTDFPKMETINLNDLSSQQGDFNLAGKFPVLRTINISGGSGALTCQLGGMFSILRTVNISSTSGSLVGNFTGMFPLLNDINMSTSSGQMNLDFRGSWEKSCSISLESSSGRITVALPNYAKVVVKTSTSSGQVHVPSNLFLLEVNGKEKTYTNNYDPDLHPVMYLDIQTSSGSIYLN